MRNCSRRYSPTPWRRKRPGNAVEQAILVGIASIFVSIVASALTMSHRLGRLEQKIDTMWEWWLSRGADVRVGGRRRTDIAADKSK
jgi:hypothetical protein